uniref:GST C-terminal domain-containing protein n=1 Tax=Scophthalmus maximus TaxID=52904 RepID=A0A8D3E067_SCOMX
MAKSMTLLRGAGSPPCWRLMINGEHKSQEDELSRTGASLMYQRMMEVLALTDEMRWESFLSFASCFKVSAGSYRTGAFSLADVIVFPNIAYAFHFRYHYPEEKWCFLPPGRQVAVCTGRTLTST